MASVRIEVFGDIRRYQQSLSQVVTDARATAAKVAQVSVQGFGAMGAGITNVVRGIRTQLSNITGAVSSMVNGIRNGFNAVFNAVTNLKFALAAIGFTAFTKKIVDATSAMDRIRNVLLATTGSTIGAGREIAFVNSLAQRLGLSLAETAFSWAKFTSAAQLSGMSVGE